LTEFREILPHLVAIQRSAPKPTASSSVRNEALGRVITSSGVGHRAAAFVDANGVFVRTEFVRIGTKVPTAIAGRPLGVLPTLVINLAQNLIVQMNGRRYVSPQLDVLPICSSPTVMVNCKTSNQSLKAERLYSAFMHMHVS